MSKKKKKKENLVTDCNARGKNLKRKKNVVFFRDCGCCCGCTCGLEGCVGGGAIWFVPAPGGKLLHHHLSLSRLDIDSTRVLLLLAFNCYHIWMCCRYMFENIFGTSQRKMFFFMRSSGGINTEQRDFYLGFLAKCSCTRISGVFFCSCSVFFFFFFFWRGKSGFSSKIIIRLASPPPHCSLFLSLLFPGIKKAFGSSFLLFPFPPLLLYPFFSPPQLLTANFAASETWQRSHSKCDFLGAGEDGAIR